MHDWFFLMCGISGVIDLKSPTKEQRINDGLVRKMLDKIRHRGPDEMGIVSGNGYSLGTVRLKILGNEQGKQPFQNRESALVFNGEIYNYKDLRKDYLENLPNVDSDSNILFHFLNTYGLEKIDALNGMFGFCYIDKDYIYLVRDRFGKKPLYYIIRNGYLYFASEVKAFLDIITFELKLPSLYRYLESPLDGETVFKDIFEIKAGHFVKINRRTRKIEKKQYYSLFTIQENKETEKQLTERLRWLVEDAVKIRTDTSLPYGVYISGGIDSSIIALLTKPEYILTYLPKSRYIEAEDRYANLIAQRLPNSNYLTVDSPEENFLKQLIQVIYFNGGPTTTLASFSQYILSQTLASYDIRMAFSGLGVDEFFNGYIRHALTLVPKQYLGNPIFNQYKALVTLSNGKNEKALKYTSLLNRSSSKSDTFTHLVETVFKKSPSISAAVSICDAQFTLPPLLHTDDHLNMAHGVESRAPFMDYRIIQFALSLPDEMKVRMASQNQISLKYLLKKAFKDVLPPEIYDREDKIGFSSNVNDKLRGESSYLVVNATNILNTYAPHLMIFESRLKFFHQYVRWEFQVVQLAITYLLYCRKYAPTDVELIMKRGYV